MTFNLRSPFKQPPPNYDSLLYRRSSVKKRRRLKVKPTTTTATPSLAIRGLFGDFISDFVSRFPSVDTVAPALGLASGLGFYIRNLNKTTKQNDDDDGEWMLFTTPSPFTRFVLLRCPSLCFIGHGDVNEKLLKVDRHSVRFDGSGVYGEKEVVEGVEYQRLCVPTDDGGVICLDFPEHLNLGEDDGLDTTLLLVPGSTQGSMCDDVQLFVSQSLKRGCFPVVLNPRGCSGSPLTTPRMFTAADSDDVCKAVQFISKMRPRTAIMGVGWGYGANMLTKYLAEVGYKTPLTAAACIDNPFDLPKVSKTFQQKSNDQKLLRGLKTILRSNKEIFQGRTKGFEVEKALLAESVSEFESFISMVSYRFQTIEDFYSACSTHNAVKNIRVPVLFIQSDKEIQPLFYAPHSLIAENPFTSLLLCSSPSYLVDGSDPAASRCYSLTIEWLAAVELGLLKGHNPLMKDVNVSLHLPGGRNFNERGNDKYLDFGQKGFSNDFHMDPTCEMLGQNVVTTSTSSEPRILSQKNLGHEDAFPQKINSQKSVEGNSLHAVSVKENNENAIENDKGQGLQTTQLVLNMLEVSMPGTFTPEQKEKVLTAVSQGETVLKALQDAVPEDARAKLTSTVTEILNSGKNLKLDGFLKRGKKSITVPDPEPSVLKKSKKTSDVDGSSSQSSINGAVCPEEHELGETFLGTKQQTGENDSDHVDDNASSVPEGIVGSMDGVTESSVKDKVEHTDNNNTHAFSDNKENVNVTGDEMSSKDSAVGNKEPTVDQSQRNEVHGTPESASKDENSTPTIEEKDKDFSADTNKIERAETGQAVSAANSDPLSDVGKDTQDIGTQPVQDNSKDGISNNAPPSINVSETFDALAGVDDSTQMAVNSVFGVIEGVITQLEEKTDNEKEITNIQDVDDEKNQPANNNIPDIEEKVSNANQQSSKIKFSVNGGGSMKSHSKITNEKANENVVQPSSESDTYLSWSHGASLGNMVNNDDQASSSNLSCAPHSVSDLSENPPRSPEKHMFSNSTGLDMNIPTSPSFDCLPEEAQLKYQEQTEILGDFDKSKKIHFNGFSGREKVTDTENTTVGTELPKKYVTGQDKDKNGHEAGGTKNEGVNDVDLLVKRIIMDSIEAEILSRLSETEVKEISHNLAEDLDLVSCFIRQAVKEEKIAAWSSNGGSLDNDGSSMFCGNLHAERIVKAVSFTVSKTHYLRKILPVDVIVGCSLAALKKHFDVIICHDNGTHEETRANYKLSSGAQVEDNVNEKNNGLGLSQTFESRGLDVSEKFHAEKSSSQNVSAMVGAATAAVGASALLMQDSYIDKENTEAVTKSLKKKAYNDKEPDMYEVEIPEAQNNLVTSIADKAIAVAGPVVPMKENGVVDQERIVSMLANLGQNGGILKLVGKAALLWGGMRGAMSLTDKLISFLHLSERPLFQRLIGFGGMVMVLWSPIYIPLLATLIRGWATKTPSKSAELTCIIGLYVAVTVLITLWGKRIRGYERPLKQYGLDFSLPMFKTFVMAYVYGAFIVLAIQYVNMVVGCASVSLVTCMPLGSSTWLSDFGNFFLLVAQGTISATGVALVEELLFRSWLPEEISKEFGFHVGIIVAGFTFSVFQRSLGAMPGLWLLSLALAGAKKRSKGSLSTPIGLRAGMMTAGYVLQKVGFLTYGSKVPLWLKFTDPVQPLSGITGLGFSLLLAIFLYPRQSDYGFKAARAIRE